MRGILIMEEQMEHYSVHQLGKSNSFMLNDSEEVGMQL